MADLEYLDEPNAGICVAVDMTVLRPLPIVSAGPNRLALLQGFFAECPFDATVLDDDMMRAAFLSYLEGKGVLDGPDNPPMAGGDVESVADGAPAAEDALATAEATNHTDTPPEQPADTDTAESPPAQTVKVQCWNCGGDGTVQLGDDGEVRTCGICQGRKWVEQAVAA